MHTAQGKIWKVGSNINTDDIIPAVYLVTTDEKELAKHCFETYAPELLKEIKQGDILLAGDNFGCGSSREHAPKALKGLGIRCVIAKSFARIFFRNSINTGLIIVECPQMYETAKTGHIAELQFEKGVVKNVTTKSGYRFVNFPQFLQEIISAGGLMQYVRRNRKTLQTQKGE